MVTPNVPAKFIPYAGKSIDGSHVHYHVEGYGTADWAIPVEFDDFPAKVLTKKNYTKEFGDILNALTDVINLQTKLTVESELMYGMD